MEQGNLVIPKIGNIQGYALIVDLNHFTAMVASATVEDSIAQFTRDCLAGAIHAIESEGGQIVGFMGDAILGIIQNDQAVVQACFGIAKDLDRSCEYISRVQEKDPDAWAIAPGGFSIKIAIEYGKMDVSTITSRLLGEQRLLIGPCINYAARISSAGEGNRCIVGPVAAEKAFASYRLNGPFSVSGIKGEPDYVCHHFPMEETWRESDDPSGETFLG